MATLKTVFRQAIEGDATLTTLLTGGVYDASELPREWVSPQNTPAIYGVDGVTLKPFAVIRWGSETPTDSVMSVEMRVVDVYLYQDAGYATIQQAADRLKAMWQTPASRYLAGASDVAGGFVRWVSSLGELNDPALSDAPMTRVRFQVDLSR